MFTDRDLTQLRHRGIAPEEAADQLRLLQQSPRPIILDRPCTVGDGIVQLAASQHAELLDTSRQASAERRVQKFVPASGAATRMFKDLIAALAGDEQPSATPAARAFFDRLDDYPFAELLRERSGIRGAIEFADDERTILRTLLEDMRYAQLPKALIPFHRRPVLRTAFEEHLLEGARYTRSRDRIARTHFTVAPEFREDFERLLTAVGPRVSAATDDTTPAVSFSEQHPSTDTLAATLDGQPFRTPEGTLLFRPSGHGALLRNLQALAADIVAIKNIDNVLPFERGDEVVRWQQLLIGYLVRRHAASDDERPLRVCGVVKNEGEPGGAPFWVTHEDGRRSMQIVEASQVNLDDAAQRRIFESSTHFNPVNIVCALQSKDGRPFDLQAFVDRSAVFLSTKSHDGRDLVALERPGLWNGAMAWWDTVCIEVPASTFAPVKTVFDLLRPEHQSL
ncbi:MAG TPA: DUF4301 family protein [Vicinamibacterales bacterium]|nr:DUF4301 family protein [Vicinamibacterales bacterium]